MTNNNQLPLDGLYYGLSHLEFEHRQLIDEGRDLASIAAELDDLKHQPQVEHERVVQLMERATELPIRSDYPFVEPSDLAGIQAARIDAPHQLALNLSDAELSDRQYGAWLGRCAGCLLGKPVEGWNTARIHGYLRDLGLFPLHEYMRYHVDSAVQSRYQLAPGAAFIDLVPHMVEDDDLNYTVIGLAILKRYGANFTPADVVHFWLENLPIFHTYTAERVAYSNFCKLIPPPRSALVHNPYREMIGAQIRADFWGYANPGNPERAADFAWRDASISHIKNGIYGEMWSAAMLAAAPCLTDVRAVILQGLAEIPANSRLVADIHQVLDWQTEGIDYDTAFTRLHQRWNEHQSYDWLHTNSNAQIVAIGLLWGEEDFERSICRAVQCGLDTDCNGATVGSIFGMMHGARALPSKWLDPLHDTLATGVAGYHLMSISKLADETFTLTQALAR